MEMPYYLSLNMKNILVSFFTITLNAEVCRIFFFVKKIGKAGKGNKNYLANIVNSVL